MHNFENFTKVKLRDILLTGTGHRDRRLNRDCPGQTGTYGRSKSNYIIVSAHSGLCPFGIVSIRDCVHSGLCPFGIVSIRDGVHSGLCPFGMVSIRDCVHSEWCSFGIVSFGIVSIRDGVYSGNCLHTSKNTSFSHLHNSFLCPWERHVPVTLNSQLAAVQLSEKERQLATERL